MSKKAKKVRTGRVKAISVSRLYNTGNYTNVRYDLSCEIEKGQSARATLIEMVRILGALAPINRPSSLDSLERARQTKLSERSNYQKENYPEWLREEAEYKRRYQKRSVAVEDLDRLGGTMVEVDHKLSWDIDDTPF